MASSDWMEIYRSYTDDELTAESAMLRQQATLFTQQSSGNKSYAKDLGLVTARLHAVTRVQNERGIGSRPGQGNSGVFDFSQIKV